MLPQQLQEKMFWLEHSQMQFHAPRASPAEGRWKAALEQAPNCPRCDSPNTKFCYYNNYSLAQPRYLCKGCRRYWTKGGSLRNVPIGGGCRKNRRGKSLHPRQQTSGGLRRAGRGQEDILGDQQRSDELHAVELERGLGKSDTTMEGTGLPAAGGGVEADDDWDVLSMNWEAEFGSMSSYVMDQYLFETF
ncbi:hypothetical protein HPP92_009310 [Vanilla planifolia]|uniref:Dof zinc finger protein n=1 Tax=Vanilla planifolia TaxID=51239 RepID=A0A835V6U6_VANPL|nr:hypothetical protein HPP92_009310 [Vanilla planifolia]